jgi:hypothetical protein
MVPFGRPVVSSIGSVGWTLLFSITGLAFAALMVVMLRKLHDAPHPEPAYGVIALSLAVSIGLVAQRKWAALLFAAGSASFGAYMAYGSIVMTHREYARGIFVESLVFFVPAIVVYWYWNALRWRGRFGL